MTSMGLMRARLRRVGSAKIGRWSAVLILLGFSACVVGLGVADGRGASLAGFVTATAKTSAWLSAGFIALAAAHQRSLSDRRDGLEVLASMRGASLRTLGLARFLGTGVDATLVVLVPSVVVDLLTVSFSGNVHVAALRALLLFPIALFSLATGFALSFLAVLADVLRPMSGRSLFTGAIVLPWAIFDLLGHPAISVPGALGGLLSVSLQALGLGGLA